MKINKILMGLGAVAALSLGACSNDEPTTGTNPDEPGFGDQYITVSVMMPNTIGSRADVVPPYNESNSNNASDKYDQGTEAESAVSSATFLFFDSNKNVVDIQKPTDVNWSNNENWANNNPYVNKIGETDIRLKSGLEYSWVAVLLNSTLDVSVLRARIKDLASFEDFTRDYAAPKASNGSGQILSDGSGQMMSNSVYFETSGLTVKPEEDQRVILVPITDENKYKEGETGKPAVEVYVERVVARVDVKMTLGLNNDNTVQDFYVSGTNPTNKLVLFDNVTFTQREVEVVPVLNGVMLDVLTPNCKLVKPLEINDLGYKQGATNYDAFQWNDPANKRSYWATTKDFDKNDMRYFSWTEMSGKGLKAFKQYVNPNTQVFNPLPANEDRSKNTKVVVAATLKYKEKGSDELKDLDLVQFGSEYMFHDNFLMQVANVANNAVRGIDWASATMQGNETEGTIAFTAAEATVLNVAVYNSFLGYEKKADDTYAWVGMNPTMFALGHKEFDKPAEANNYESEVVSIMSVDNNYAIDWNKDKFADYTDEAVKALLDNEDALKALAVKAAPFIEKAIDETVKFINETRILHWNDGLTYYYYVIRHQGFFGLVGDKADNYVFGLVRNHIYDVDLQALYGLGTPVINPNDPIDPERPSDEDPTYIKAKINILPWRVVKNNATLH